jgi:site-specific DNA-adenine methylase
MARLGMPLMKSPLKAPHNFKSMAVLKELIPEKSIVESYFLYSGQLEIALAAADRLVVAHTDKYPVYEFWWTVKQAAPRVAAMASNVFEQLEDEMYTVLQENWHSYKDPIYRSALFFILNRCSDSAMASSGRIDKNGFNPISLSRLRKFEADNLYVLLDKEPGISADANQALRSDFKLFVAGRYGYNLLDENYVTGHDRVYIEHRALLQQLQQLDDKWVVLYKKHSAILEKFKGYNLIMVNQYGRKTDNFDACEDMLIANF